MMKLDAKECPEYYASYLEHVGHNILTELNQQLQTYPEFILKIPKEKLHYRYSSEKWSIKQIVGHITDTERIMTTRAVRISRDDNTPLPGFAQNDFVANAHFDKMNIAVLMQDFKAARQNTLSFFSTLNSEDLLKIGIASEKPVSVRAIFYIIIGHLLHHKTIIKQRYL